MLFRSPTHVALLAMGSALRTLASHPANDSRRNDALVGLLSLSFLVGGCHGVLMLMQAFSRPA